MSEFTDAAATATPNRWRWLIDLRDHLLPGIEVVDANAMSVLPPVRGDIADRLRRLLRTPTSPIVAALLRDATPGGPMVFARADGLRIGVLGLADPPRAPVTLWLAERADVGRETTRRADLSRMASWLARALGSTSETPVRDWREISVLHQVLQKAVARGSVEAVLSAYIEALAIWADTDSRAYLGNRAGQFALTVSLAGAAAGDAPPVLSEDGTVPDGARRRLSATDAHRLGFSTTRDTVLSSVRMADHAPWVIAYAGQISAADADRLAIFEDMLRPALLATAEVEASRLTWVMMQHLVDGPLSRREAAGLALAELERAALCTAAMQITDGAGEMILQVGPPAPAAAHAGAWPGFAVQGYVLDVAPPCRATLTLWRPPNRPFTLRESRLGGIGATVLGRWTANALDRGDLSAGPAGAPAADRRRIRAASDDVSLLVILPDPSDTAAAVRETWVRDIRVRLRPDDIIGALASGDISVLLPATNRGDAQAVASRLTRLFAQHAPLALLDGAPIGVASIAGAPAPPRPA